MIRCGCSECVICPGICDACRFQGMVCPEMRVADCIRMSRWPPRIQTWDEE